MLKFQVRSINLPVSTSSSACSSPSLSSIPSSAASSSQQRLSQISSISPSNSSVDEDQQQHLHQEQWQPWSNRYRSRHRSSNNADSGSGGGSPSSVFASFSSRRHPSPSPSSLPPPLPLTSPPSTPSPNLLAPPPIPPKPANLKFTSSSSFYQSRAKSAEREPSRRATITASALAEYAHLRIYTGQIKPDTDYKTLRLLPNATTKEVIRQLVEEKLRLNNMRDLNLFHLFMEIRTKRRADGVQVRSILELDAQARPLELQRCHPEGMSRFILGMDSNAILARIYDGEIWPESNYKSVFISRRTTCTQVLDMLRKMNRFRDCQSQKLGDNQSLGIEAISELRLFLLSTGPGAGIDTLIPANCFLAGVYLSMLPGQRIVLRRVIVPRSDGY